MAVTIQNQPTYPNAAYTHLVYTVSSDQSGQPQMQYLMDVTQGGQILSRIKQYPNPMGSGVFDPSRIMNDYIVYDQNWKTNVVSPAVQSKQDFIIYFGEEYGTSPSSSITVYNGNGSAGNPAVTGTPVEVIGAVVDPNNGYITHIFWEAHPVQLAIQHFNIHEEVEIDGQSKELLEHLKVFQIRPGSNIYAKLKEIYADFEANVTQIVMRHDVSRAFDLNMHSAIEFVFDNEPVTKGWLDTLIIGDTACGKSKTVERLQQHFRAGEIYSGENISKVGIIGGYINIGGASKRMRFVLGAFPLNHRKAVILDEGAGLPIEVWADLTHIRDHGIAQSTKQGQRNRYPAAVRLTVVSNPRDGRAVNTYSQGIMAIRELIGSDADISRFDTVVVVAGDEVDKETINRSDNSIVDHLYTSELCSLLLQWCWSRKSSHIKFSDKAVKDTYAGAIVMGNTYDPSIPLV